MIASLRALLTRPIVHDRRRLAFAVAATVLAAAALAPSLADHLPSEDPTRAEPRPAEQPPRYRVQPATSTGPTGAGTQPDATADPAAARSLARRFLPPYLAYTYGRGDARPLLEFVHPSLWLDLAARPPHVPHRLRELRPQVTYLGITATRATAVKLEAIIDDGERRYAIPLVVARAGGRWQIVSMGS